MKEKKEKKLNFNLASSIAMLFVGSETTAEDKQTVQNVISAIGEAIKKENIDPLNATPQQGERIKQIATEILQQNNILQ